MVLSDPETGKAYNIELGEEEMNAVVNKRIGDEIGGDALGLKGYKLKLTGGTDKDGFSMRRDLDGVRRPKLLLRSGPGFRPREKGLIRRKRVRSHTFVRDVAQVNAVVTKKGSKSLEKILSGEE